MAKQFICGFLRPALQDLLKRCVLVVVVVVWYADFIVMAIHSLHSNGRPPTGHEQTAESRQHSVLQWPWSSVTHTLRIRNVALQVLAYLCYLLRCSFCLLALCARFQFQLPLAHIHTHTRTQSTHDKPRIAKKMLKWQHAPQDFVYAKHNK